MKKYILPHRDREAFKAYHREFQAMAAALANRKFHGAPQNIKPAKAANKNGSANTFVPKGVADKNGGFEVNGHPIIIFGDHVKDATNKNPSVTPEEIAAVEAIETTVEDFRKFGGEAMKEAIRKDLDIRALPQYPPLKAMFGLEL